MGSTSLMAFWGSQVVGGKEYGRRFILESLNAFVEGGVHPVLYRENENGDAVFFIKGREIANTLQSASRRVRGPSDEKLTIRTFNCQQPFASLPEEDIALLKGLLEKRFSPEANHLNLSDFSNDPVVTSQPNYLGLNKNSVMMGVVNLLISCADKLHSVDLSKNQIRYLECFATLCSYCRNVQRLNLSKNSVRAL
ncbi:unnamed protein product [Soboliphyme baturini]|uniref:Tap-RNA_bind domain-containing protein n=1 Tax=Soboliphyme baturini TaxID=241478 RepID=A0A183J144_9BILA|nr:unnamed protein product [Soboliphyme baturini]